MCYKPRQSTSHKIKEYIVWSKSNRGCIVLLPIFLADLFDLNTFKVKSYIKMMEKLIEINTTSIFYSKNESDTEEESLGDGF